MTHNDRDQELLKQYMDHLLPEDDGNLEIIKQRLDKEAVRRRRKAALKRRSKRLYGLSVACILLCAAVWSAAGGCWEGFCWFLMRSPMKCRSMTSLKPFSVRRL